MHLLTAHRPHLTSSPIQNQSRGDNIPDCATFLQILSSWPASVSLTSEHLELLQARNFPGQATTHNPEAWSAQGEKMAWPLLLD